MPRVYPQFRGKVNGQVVATSPRKRGAIRSTRSYLRTRAPSDTHWKADVFREDTDGEITLIYQAERRPREKRVRTVEL